MKRILLLGAAVALGACQSDTTSPAASKATLAPASSRLVASNAAVPAIPGRYIVIVNGNVLSLSAVAASLVGSAQGTVREVYTSGVINGFAADLSDSAVAQLQRDPRVVVIEPDYVMTKSAGGTQANAPWGLDRIDQRARPLSTTYVYPGDGNGVSVYIVDTGINYSHVDFGGRAVGGYDAITAGGGAVDCDGHGSHVAGSVGGTTYGVAKAARLVGVRVLNCSGSGSNSGVIAGLNYVLQQKQANPSLRAVVNMSLGGGASTALDNAIANLSANGVTVVVAAGNSTANACNYSPARAPSAITVAASDINDRFASFSNFGSCVDITAPGVQIRSATIGTTTGTAVLSGTSMASPHAAGAAALYLSANPTATPAQVTAALTSNATPNVVTATPSATVNRLLYVGFISGGPTNQAPTASITSPASGASFVQGASVTFAGSGSDAEDGALSGGSLVWTSSRDGQIGTGTTFTKSNLSVGAHTITLTATDAQGATGTATRAITITAAPPTNQPPVADFTISNCNAQWHRCTLDGRVSTDDAGIVSYTWDLAGGYTDGPTQPRLNSRWPTAGSYQVTLTVTDAGGLSSSITKTVVAP